MVMGVSLPGEKIHTFLVLQGHVSPTGCTELPGECSNFDGQLLLGDADLIGLGFGLSILVF